MDRLLNQFQKEVFEGLSDEERELFHRVEDRISENTKNAMIRREMQ